MKQLFVEDYYKLLDLYRSDSFSEIRLLYYELKDIKALLPSSIKLNRGEQEFMCNDLRDFFSWIKLDFPNMEDYLLQNSTPIAFRNELLKFEETSISPFELIGKKFGRIKHLLIWGQRQIIKQNYQKVEEVIFDGEVLTFCLSGNAFLQAWKPKILLNSDYSLQVKISSRVVVVLPKKKNIEFKINQDFNADVLINNVFESNIDCSSVFATAIEIRK